METQDSYIQSIWETLKTKQFNRHEYMKKLEKVSKLEVESPHCLDIIDTKCALLMHLGYYNTALYYIDIIQNRYKFIHKEVLTERRVQCYYELGEYNKVPDITEMNKEESENLLVLKAFAYRNMGEHETSIEICNKALHQHPRSKEWALFQRGWSYRALGEMDKAFDDLHEIVCLSKQKKNDLAKYYATFCLAYFGDTDASIKMLNKIIAEKNTIIWKNLLAAEIYSLVGQTDKAAIALENCINDITVKGVNETISRSTLDDPALKNVFDDKSSIYRRVVQFIEYNEDNDYKEFVSSKKTQSTQYNIPKRTAMSISRNTDGVSLLIPIKVNKTAAFFEFGGESTTLINAQYVPCTTRKKTTQHKTKSHGTVTGFMTTVNLSFNDIQIKAKAIAVTNDFKNNVIGTDILSKFSKIQINNDIIALQL